MMDIAQFNMVEQQIRPWNVQDPRLLDELATLDRSLFVPEGQQALCWMDTMIQLDDGTRMLAPKTVARMLQALEIKPDDKLLQIGAGSGYMLALSARMCESVECRDASQAALDRAAAHCEAVGLSNIDFRLSTSPDALESNAYDGILLREVCSDIPEAYFHCLREQGRCVAAVGGEYVMELMCYTLSSATIQAQSIVDLLADDNYALSGLSEVKQDFVF